MNAVIARRAIQALTRVEINMGPPGVLALLLYRPAPKRKSPDKIVRAEKSCRLLASHARSGLRNTRGGRLIHGLAAFGMYHFHGNHRLDSAYGHGEIFSFPSEGQAFLLFVEVDANQIAQMDLFGGEQIGPWIDNVPFDGTLQVARAIPLVRPLLQKKITRRTRHTKQELSTRGFQ